MKFVQPCLLLAAGAISSGAFASDIRIESIRLLRQGPVHGESQGQIEIQVTQNSEQVIQVRTLSCNDQTLSMERQEKTAIDLTGQVAQEVKSILQNQARLATEQAITNPLQQSVGQNELAVFFQYETGGMTQQASKVIQAPLVIIGEQVSQVLEKVEQEARAAAQQACQP